MLKIEGGEDVHAIEVDKDTVGGRSIGSSHSLSRVNCEVT